MYLKTPTRYKRGRQERRVFGSTRWLWLWVVTPLIALVGWQVYERRAEIGPPVQALVNSALNSAREQAATLNAPTALPTIDPAQGMAQANSAWSRGAIGEALELYGQVRVAAPNDVTAHYRYAFGLATEGRTDEALQAAEDTITANPFSADAWAVRALTLGRADQNIQAVASAMQALSIDPNNARALAFMAEAYLDMGELDRAKETINRALEADPSSFEALFVSARILRDGDYDYPAAPSAFREAYALAPNMPYIAVALAWSEFYAGNTEGGLEVAEGIIDVDPQNIDALFAAANLDYRINYDESRAIEYMNRCLVIDPNNRPCLRYRAGQLSVRGNTGDAEAAVRDYTALIAAGTTNTDDYLYAGRASIDTGDCASAIDLLRDGYALERTAAEPDADTLASFEAFLSECGATAEPGGSFLAAPTAAITPEATRSEG